MPEFQARRAMRLRERARYGHAAERATEEILEDLFTTVLDWSVGDLNHQVGRADLLLSRLGIKYLIVEAKRPGALTWSRPALDEALCQAWGYACEQGVQSIAVSDGYLLYAADIEGGGLRGRALVRLDSAVGEGDLWWLSVDGIYRRPPEGAEARFQVFAEPAPGPEGTDPTGGTETVLHPRYHLPASCFAYVGNPNDPRTWALPHRSDDGTVDLKRLPKAIQAIVSNYRGTHLSRVPEEHIPDVLVRLARAAVEVGKMPWQLEVTAPAYRDLERALAQLGRLDEVRATGPRRAGAGPMEGVRSARRRASEPVGGPRGRGVIPPVGGSG